MNIPRDKLLHIAMGAFVAMAVVVLVAIQARYGLPAAMLAGGAGIGIAYELVQRLRKEGVPDPLDAAATAAGAAVVALATHWWLSA